MRQWQRFCQSNRQRIMALCSVTSLAMATFWWGATSHTGDISRVALLFIIPMGAGIGLTMGWPRQWSTIWLGVLLMYLITPFISARIEACLLPITGQLPCLADLDQMRSAGNASGHRMYFVGIIVVHTVATGVLWFFTHRQEARHVAPTHS